MADLKAQPNRGIYLQILRRMTPEQKLLKALELSEFTRQLFIAGLRDRHPELSEQAFRTMVVERLRRCHNRNY